MDRARAKLSMNRIIQGAVLALVLLLGCSNVGHAQEPPLAVPGTAPLTKPSDVIALGGWLLYPQVRVFGLRTDNLFQSTINPISTWGYGISPNVSAEYTNGIHTTTVYADMERRWYPQHADIDAFDYHAGVSQRYSPLRDLTFSINEDFAHRTNSSPLVNGIPGQVFAPTAFTLPNGNTVLPNGNIIDPSGNVVGQTSPALRVLPANNLLFNPFDQWTTSATAEKYLNRGLLRVSGSLGKTEYASNEVTPNLVSKSMHGYLGFWLGPLLYAYSDASMGWLNFESTQLQAAYSTNSYRAVAGLGTARLGLFHLGVYAGHQGTQFQNGSAGGDIYGGRINYDPLPYWTFSASVEELINIATQNAFAPNVALFNPTPTPALVSASVSTRTTSSFFDTSYSIARDWALTGRVGYTKIEFIDSTRVDNAWLGDVTLRYDIMKNLSALWEYQYSSIVSNQPGFSSHRNLYQASLTYKF
jgi:hypothetical protein